MMSNLPDEVLGLTNLINESSGSLALGNPKIQAAALTATKFVFDLGWFDLCLVALLVRRV